MSTDPMGHPEDSPGGGEGASAQPSEEELRAAYEAELSRLTSTDVLAQAAVSLLNIGARRLGLLAEGAPAGARGGEPDARSEPDLEQVRDAIDAVKAMLEILDRRIPGELRSLRDALSQLQMAYAREVQAAGAGSEARPPAPSTAPPAAKDAEESAPPKSPDGPGPAESSGRLWVPGR